MIPLNSAVHLTRGNPAGTTALFAHFAPAHRSFIGLLEKNEESPVLIGQVEIPAGYQSARLTFLLSNNGNEIKQIPYLLDGLVKQAGQLGAMNITAELPESHPAIESFRRCGFSVYARERIWHLSSSMEKPAHEVGHWSDFNEMDRFYIQSLYQSLVPPIVQRVEGFSNSTIQGLIYMDRGERYGLVDCMYGLQGVFLQPYIHPEVENTAAVIQQLMQELPAVFDRSVYIAVRSYQAWLEHDLDELGAKVSDTMVLLVKHMGLHTRSLEKEPLWAALEKGKAQPSPTTYQRMDGKLR
ncbi:MAG: hypothetical protein JEZ00_06740 [Anaerolineaceae bacterium]|nr:hypothetical protein [Anaerolineaceae bacterium]